LGHQTITTSQYTGSEPRFNEFGQLSASTMTMTDIPAKSKPVFTEFGQRSQSTATTDKCAGTNLVFIGFGQPSQSMNTMRDQQADPKPVFSEFTATKRPPFSTIVEPTDVTASFTELKLRQEGQRKPVGSGTLSMRT